MEKIQLLIGSMIVLVICIIIRINNTYNFVYTSAVVNIISVISCITTIYLYSTLNDQERNALKGVVGGDPEFSDDDGDMGLITNMESIL